jgi:hypothetical protein
VRQRRSEASRLERNEGRPRPGESGRDIGDARPPDAWEEASVEASAEASAEALKEASEEALTEADGAGNCGPGFESVSK